MLNNCVLSLVLKVSNDVGVIMSVGKTFQIWAPILVKDESWASAVWALATGSLFSDANLSCLFNEYK